MTKDREIGGYFELECAQLPILHNGQALFVNSACNALRYVIRAKKIEKVALPYFTCPSVWAAVLAEGCDISPYDVDDSFYPTTTFNPDTAILYTDYFGICSQQVKQLSELYPRLIVDSAQAFYAKARGWASFNSPRKFFGVADGGMVFCKEKLEIPHRSQSFARCSQLLKRHDLGATAGYSDFIESSTQLDCEPLALISSLTHAMLSNIDYAAAAHRRLENFHQLHAQLGNTNQLSINLQDRDIPMVYPYKTSDETLRNRLIDQQIYVAKYWPIADGCDCMRSQHAQQAAASIIPLPIDQRYNEEDMKRIIKIINPNNHAI